MRGRPITREEFERMMMVCEKVRPDDHRVWNALLEGLWLTGLRLGEALALSREHDSGFGVDAAGKYPCFAISAESEKGFEDRRLPMTPDFADWLTQTPIEDREGKVFGVAKLGLRLDSVSKVICRIGKVAGVVVNREQGKFASAHDFRRAFGTRWASKLKPAELQQIMRHASISTTLGYYVLFDANSLAERLREASNSFASVLAADKLDESRF